MALKGHKVSKNKKKLLFAQTQVLYLGHLLSKQGLLLHPDETPHDCLMLTGYLWNPSAKSQETPLTNADCRGLLIDGSYKKDEKDKYCAGLLLQLVLKSSRQHLYILASSAQQAESHALTGACALAKGKMTSIYADSWSAFGVARDFGILWKQQIALTSYGNKLKMSMSKIY